MHKETLWLSASHPFRIKILMKTSWNLKNCSYGGYFFGHSLPFYVNTNLSWSFCHICWFSYGRSEVLLVLNLNLVCHYRGGSLSLKQFCHMAWLLCALLWMHFLYLVPSILSTCSLAVLQLQDLIPSYPCSITVLLLMQAQAMDINSFLRTQTCCPGWSKSSFCGRSFTL